MGNTTSSSQSYASVNEKDGSVEEIVNRLQNHLNLDEKVRNEGPSTFADLANPLSLDKLVAWENNILASPKNVFALNAFTKNEIKNLITRRDSRIKDDENIFNLKVDNEGSPVTNQKSSGRCWLFASTNVFRIPVQKKFNIANFQLSQQYLFFYDKLEKANQFLTNIIETAEGDVEYDRVVATLFSDPISDGGQWTMVINLVEKYGLVPQSVYPDAFSATSSSTLNYILVNKLKQDALVIRSKVMDSSTSKEEIEELKDQYLSEIYKILTLTLGVPPKADEKINWEFVDKFDNFYKFEVTPKEFYSKFVGLDLPNYVSLINDPRNEYYKLYSVDKLNNVVGGNPVLYINTPIEHLKEVVIKNLKNNQPVFFGSDVGKFYDSTGILDLDNYDYQLGFDITLELSKADRLQTGSSQMTHAMVITGVHLENGKPVRWRVENSWGSDSGKNGFLVMTDRWFDEYVYQVVTDLKYSTKEVAKISKGDVYKVFPLYDPMGSLA